MEVTKKEGRAESKEVKRPEIDPAIIEELLKGYERPTDLTSLPTSCSPLTLTTDNRQPTTSSL